MADKIYCDSQQSEVPRCSRYLPGAQSQDGHPPTSGQLQVSGHVQSGKERLWAPAKPFKSALPLPPACDWLQTKKIWAIIRGGREFGLAHPLKNIKTDCSLLKNSLSELIMAILAILHWWRLQVFVNLTVSAFLQEKWCLGSWHMPQKHFSSHLS